MADFIYLFYFLFIYLFNHFHHNRETSCGGGRTTERGSKLRTVPANSKVFLCRFMIMQERQIFPSVIEIQIENLG